MYSHSEKQHSKGNPEPKKKQERAELRCNLCQYQCKHNGKLMEHFEKRHKDFTGFKCELCDDFDSADSDVRLVKNPFGGIGDIKPQNSGKRAVHQRSFIGKPVVG